MFFSGFRHQVNSDFRGLGGKGYQVVHGKRSFGGSEPYHVDTIRSLTWKEREFLFALRARDDVSEGSPLDVGISRAAGQKLMHSSCLVVPCLAVSGGGQGQPLLDWWITCKAF
eukprot:g31663.t1